MHPRRQAFGRPRPSNPRNSSRAAAAGEIDLSAAARPCTLSPDTRGGDLLVAPFVRTCELGGFQRAQSQVRAGVWIRGSEHSVCTLLECATAAAESAVQQAGPENRA
jgi:hypothetical protein